MTNKEKAAEIAHDLITHQVQDDWWYPRAQEHYEEALEKMGDWKDEQLKQILQAIHDDCPKSKAKHYLTLLKNNAL